MNTTLSSNNFSIIFNADQLGIGLYNVQCTVTRVADGATASSTVVLQVGNYDGPCPNNQTNAAYLIPTEVQQVINPDNIYFLKLLNNPVHDLLQIQYNMPEHTIPQIVITDMYGRVLKKTTIGSTDNQQFEIQIPEFAAGYYILNVNSGSYKKSISFIKTK